MKIPLYMDIYPGQKSCFCAMSEVGAKIDGTKRFRILVEIPDPLEVDNDAPIIEQSEVDK